MTERAALVEPGEDTDHDGVNLRQYRQGLLEPQAGKLDSKAPVPQPQHLLQAVVLRDREAFAEQCGRSAEAFDVVSGREERRDLVARWAERWAARRVGAYPRLPGPPPKYHRAVADDLDLLLGEVVEPPLDDLRVARGLGLKWLVPSENVLVCLFGTEVQQPAVTSRPLDPPSERLRPVAFGILDSADQHVRRPPVS